MSRATLETRVVDILESADAPLNTRQVAALLGTTRGAAHSALWRMLRAGCVTRRGTQPGRHRGWDVTLWGVVE